MIYEGFSIPLFKELLLFLPFTNTTTAIFLSFQCTFAILNEKSVGILISFLTGKNLSKKCQLCFKMEISSISNFCAIIKLIHKFLRYQSQLPHDFLSLYFWFRMNEQLPNDPVIGEKKKRMKTNSQGKWLFLTLLDFSCHGKMWQ